ncbi:MFS transporter [Williamsia sp.]|uniref:MFS transporter n=1 Tax=Williamsia sp. TaxID=1872085 RepID=UPI001A20DCD1|nr:MFS transporter [Williamsia sp.]MBJ7291699.1 MFS transporter [Williamsia sp.]
MQFSITTRLAVYSLLFSSGMWMSKTAQPLYFEAAGALTAFGAGYAVMAVAGGLSFFWGALADRIGGLNLVRIGLVLYAVGLTGRLLTGLVPVIVFSAVAGFGASAALVAIRPWIRSMVPDDDIPRLVAVRNSTSQAGVFVGTLGAAAVLLLGDTGPTVALALAPVLVLLAALWLSVGSVPDGQRTRTDAGDPPPDHQKPTRGRSLAIALMAISALSGLYVSMVTPYVPLILTGAGGTASEAAVGIALLSACQFSVSSVLARYASLGSRPFVAFVGAEIAAGVLTLGVSALLDFSFWIVVVAFVVRAAMVSIAVVTEETVQYALVPANGSGLVFGLAQSGFLAGDAIGGLVGAQLWEAGGGQLLLEVAGVLTLANAVLVVALLGRRWSARSELAAASTVS